MRSGVGSLGKEVSRTCGSGGETIHATTRAPVASGVVARISTACSPMASPVMVSGEVQGWRGPPSPAQVRSAAGAPPVAHAMVASVDVVRGAGRPWMPMSMPPEAT